MSARQRLIAALEGSPEVRPGTAPALVADALNEVADSVLSLCSFEKTFSPSRRAAQVSENVGLLAAAGLLRRIAEQPIQHPADCWCNGGGKTRWDAANGAWETAGCSRHVTSVGQTHAPQQEICETPHVTIEDEDACERACTLDALATEYRVRADGRTDLLVRREPNGTRWAIVEALSDRGVRRARTPHGWDMVYLLSGDELFVWPDAASAVAEAQRVLGAGDR